MNYLASCLALSPFIEASDNGPRARKMSDFLTLNIPLHDLLPELLSSGNANSQLAALELYLRRIYPLHNLRGLQGSALPLSGGAEALTVKFQFFNDAMDAAGMTTATSVASLAECASSPRGS